MVPLSCVGVPPLRDGGVTGAGAGAVVSLSTTSDAKLR